MPPITSHVGLGAATLKAVATVWESSHALETSAPLQVQIRALTNIQRSLRRLGITKENSPLPGLLLRDLKGLREKTAAKVSLPSLVALAQLQKRLATIPGVGVMLTEPDTAFVALFAVEDNMEVSTHPAAAATTWGVEHVYDPAGAKGRIASVYATKLDNLTKKLMRDEGLSKNKALYRASLILNHELIDVAIEWQKAACIDALTTVLARSIGMQLVHEAIVVTKHLKSGQKARCHPVPADHVLVMVDIDHFKRLNDTYGHCFGDQVLREVGNTLNKTVGRPEDFVVRYGGEEFLILLRHTNMDGAASAIRRILERICSLEFVTDEDNTVKITASFGYAPIKNGVSSPAEVEQRVREATSRADAALYAAKRGTLTNGTGRNQAVAWTPAMGETPPKS